MQESFNAVVLFLLVVIGSFVSIELAVSAAIIEISLGVLGGNYLGVFSTEWLKFIAAFGGILLTFLAGAEVDLEIMRKYFKGSMLIGGISFIAPFIAAWGYFYYFGGWSAKGSQIAGIALSTTSLAVVYAVLVETGLTDTKIGKIIMASTFVTDFGTSAGLSILFAEASMKTLYFFLISLLLIALAPFIFRFVVKRYGSKVIEPEIKFLFLLMIFIIFLAKWGSSHAILPAFVLGLVLSPQMSANKELTRRLRVVSFAFISPFFFINGGLNVSLKLLYENFWLLVTVFLVKMIPKTICVYPVARKYVKKEAVFTTLLMSTGLTMGTISSVFGYQAGYISKVQFSVLLAAVVLSAIIPTYFAQKFFEPKHALDELKKKGVT